VSEYIHDKLIATIVDFDHIKENAKRHEDDFDGFHCAKCREPMHVDSEYDPSPLCFKCAWVVLDALAREVQQRRAEREQRAMEVPTQRNVRYRGGRR